MQLIHSVSQNSGWQPGVDSDLVLRSHQQEDALISNRVMDADEDKEKDEGPKMKKVKQKTEEWEQLNTQNAIWLRDPSDVTPEEYEKFYQAISKVRRCS